ncbi:calcineurin-like phosphoesterase C-terminal domain-containing protein [Pedobacter heparinus]|uniref:Putative calcineurin phosphoesterase n=1 Tax=Pedobacter heparinus (strain ATCC 13125 / DSM 2366 / CIP 104194 / JCM 7457 / NBRC 12017 / NCIMB 9290 / NRRL B-14731 / HIM 762-3) TaxID=485917 RepID=C6XZW5_PEDHD|nr:calcineurin-like phosphoesterase family protein [Pedobacter heparinus]ACU02660.1 putative calcineurin phosphoesterase [Pedobacter heparinus DSM 2366]
MKPLSFFLFLLLSCALKAQNTASGYVFADANGNGKKDKTEKGIANVAVTNGQEVVQTNSKGYYTLPVGNDNIISVIKPTGYQVPLNADNLPQYFYIHKPQGSPQFKYKGVAPTGPLPAAVNFALKPVREQDNYTALIFGDPQVYNQEQVDYFVKDVISEVEGIKNMSFGISMGDEVGDKLDLFPAYTAAVKRVGIPWYNMMGNHDLNADAPADSLSDESFEAHFGPTTYAFNYGKVHFVVLDDVLYPDPRDGRGYYGGLRDDQLKFIEQDLKYVPKDYLVVMTMHIPLSEPEFLFSPTTRLKLFNLLKDFPHTLSISAHTHMQRQDFYVKGSEWLQDKPHHHFNIGTASGDFYSGLSDKNGTPVSTMRDGTPKGYGFIHFKGNQYIIDYKVAGEGATTQMRITAPEKLKKDTDTAAYVYVNFYTGAKNDILQYRIDDGSWMPLQHTFEFDPFYIAEVATWKSITDKTKKARRPSNPAKSTHLWKGPISTRLQTGRHSIEVKATDMFNRSFIQKSSYTIE